MKLVALLPLILLAGCATPEPTVRIVTVLKPVSVPCTPATLGGAPLYPDTDEALRSAIDAAERYRLLFVGRVLRDARLGELEPVILNCREEVAK